PQTPSVPYTTLFRSVAHHLAAVAHAQREAVLALEERLEAVTGTGVEQDRLGPAFTSPQDVAVREAAARYQALELLQADASGQDVAHVHVDSAEACTVEGRGHFHLAVDALLTQDRHLRAQAFLDVGRRNVLIHIEGQLGSQARVFFVEEGFELLVGTVGVIAQALDLVAGFA